jgi:hypothetical protein
MLGSYVGGAFEKGPEAAGVRFYGALLDWAGVRAPITVQPTGLEVRSLVSGEDQLVFVLNHGKAETTAEVSLGSGARATDVVTGKPVEVVEKDGHVVMRGPVGARDVWVVRVQP